MAAYLRRIEFPVWTPALLLVLVTCIAISPLAASAADPADALPSAVQPQIRSLAAGDQAKLSMLVGQHGVLMSMGLKADEAMAALSQIHTLAGGDSQRITSLVGQYGILRAKGLSPNDTATKLAENVQQQQQGKQDQQASDGTKNFLGVKWGLGVALSSSLGGGDRVTSASVVNGVVRVQQTTNQQPRIISEIHYFFCRKAVCDPEGTDKSKQPLSGNGPWVGIQSSTDQLLDSIAFGYMWGWRHDPTKSSSFNLGVGALVDAKVQVLGDGVRANAPLPGGGTTVPLKNESKTGAVVVASFSF